MNISKEMKLKSECFKEHCQYAERRCISYKGRNCTRLGGNKIPVFQTWNREYPSSDPLKMKPYFMDGRNLDDDREGEDT